MAAVIAAAVLGATLAVALNHAGAVIAWGRRHLPGPKCRCADGPCRDVDCSGCGDRLPVCRARRISESFAAHDAGPGGTAVSTEWHRRCWRKARRRAKA